MTCLILHKLFNSPSSEASTLSSIMRTFDRGYTPKRSKWLLTYTLESVIYDPMGHMWTWNEALMLTASISSQEDDVPDDLSYEPNGVILGVGVDEANTFMSHRGRILLLLQVFVDIISAILGVSPSMRRFVMS